MFPNTPHTIDSNIPAHRLTAASRYDQHPRTLPPAIFATRSAGWHDRQTENFRRAAGSGDCDGIIVPLFLNTCHRLDSAYAVEHAAPGVVLSSITIHLLCCTFGYMPGIGGGKEKAIESWIR
ncbi:MAG: hypothetical protein KatS3mg111_1755 [Pirellulaceae bacterium]|nr:MAG: hypothetical protein KatS3mg111_1755 [Pirellulaceae bacterium]